MEYQFNIPWIITLQIDSDFFLNHQQEYLDTIKAGNALGIYSWMIFSEGQLCPLLSFISANSDNTFFFFCNAEDITPEIMDILSSLKNLMLVVRYEENAEIICDQLRKARLIYSVYYPYTEKDIAEIENGDLLCSIQELHPIFTVFFPKRICSDAVQKSVYRIIQAMRDEQQYKTIPWELCGDNCNIDKIISDDSCMLFFDKEGNTHQWENGIKKEAYNLFSQSLFEILQQLFPKEPLPNQQKA